MLHFVRTVKPWGWEIGVDVKRVGQLKLLRYLSGESTSLQYHERKTEILWLFWRRPHSMVIAHGRDYCRHEHWRPFFIRHGVVHRVIGPAFALEISTYHPTDVVRLDDRYGR